MICIYPLIYGNTQYRRGDILPSGTGMDAAWEAAGSACSEEVYAEMLALVEPQLKATRAADKAGRVGFSTNAGTREGLIGVIPKISGRYENGNGL